MELEQRHATAVASAASCSLSSCRRLGKAPESVRRYLHHSFLLLVIQFSRLVLGTALVCGKGVEVYEPSAGKGGASIEPYEVFGFS